MLREERLNAVWIRTEKFFSDELQGKYELVKAELLGIGSLNVDKLNVCIR